MQRTIKAGRARRGVSALAIVLGVAAVASGCIPSQPNLKNAYLVNTERISRGLKPFGWDDELAAKARGWAQQMADTNTVVHSDLTDGISSGWAVLGENVGAGQTIDQVHDAFMNSPEHRRVILSRSYNTMGIGVYERNGEYWVVEVYKG
jgi:uncharacterized protein YkwD